MFIILLVVSPVINCLGLDFYFFILYFKYTRIFSIKIVPAGEAIGMNKYSYMKIRKSFHSIYTADFFYKKKKLAW